MKSKKLISILMSVILAVTMMPAVAFAGIEAGPAKTGETHTWGDGDSEEEKESDVIIEYEGENHEEPENIDTIRFKKGYYEPYTIINVNDEIGSTGEDKTLGVTELHNFANAEMGKWAAIASKIYKSECAYYSRKDDEGGMCIWNGTRFLDMQNERDRIYWKDYFENETSSKVRINLADWLASKEKKEELSHRNGSSASGIKIANSLAEARQALAEQVGNHIDGKPEHILAGRKSGGDRQGTLDQIKDNTPRTVFYSHVAWSMDDPIYDGFWMYSGYGIALYDFTAVPIFGNGLYNQNQQDPDYKGTDKNPIPGPRDGETPYENKGDTDGAQTYSQSTKVGETITESNTHDYSFTVGAHKSRDDSIKVSKTFGPEKKPLVFSVGTESNIGAEAAFMTAWGDQHSVADDRSWDETLAGDIPAQTCAWVRQSDDLVTKDVGYEGPMEISYKVAIYAITADKPLIGRYENYGDYCVKFFSDDAEGGYGATENLHNRANEDNDDIEVRYGTRNTSGYLEKNRIINNVKWDKKELTTENVRLGGRDTKIKDFIDNASTTLSFTTPSFIANSTRDSYENSVRFQPLYALTNIRLKSEYDSEYEMIEGHSKTIPDDTVEGLNKNNVKYHGFEPTFGGWQVAEKDPDGNTVSEEKRNAVKISQDANKRWVIEAKECDEKIDDIWLTWRMDDRAHYTSKDEVTVDAQHDEGVTYPFIRLAVNPDVENKSIEFKRAEGEEHAKATTYAFESVNLYDALPVILRNTDDQGIISSHTEVEYSLLDPDDADKAGIDEEGLFYSETPGEYRIKATYKGSLDTSDHAIVTVGEARELRAETTDPNVTLGPVTPSADIELEKYVKCVDQDGNDWTLYEPKLDFELADKTLDPKIAAITVDNEGRHILTVTAEGVDPQTNRSDYPVNIFDVTGEGEPKKIGELTAKISRDPGVEPPVAEAGMMYNGSEQIGVKEGEDYTLKDHIQINAGSYVATATLNEGKCWSDNGGDKPRKIAFEIARKPVDEPKVIENLKYNGKKQAGVAEGEGYDLRDNTGIDAGSYEAVATLDDNHIWDDGTVRDMMLEWSIAVKPIKPAVKLSTTSYTYNGKVRTPSVTVKDGSTVLKKDRDYTVSYASGRKNVGKYNVTVTCKGNYSGKTTTSFTIKKASNPLKLKAKTAGVSYKKLKKKTQTLSRSKAFTVSKAQGKVTYKKSKGNKKIKINKKNGKVTVKKGLKKGTYKVKVKVTAAGNKNYNKTTRSVTFKIRVR